MILNLTFLIVGLALILWGANSLTDGSVTIAERLGVPQIVIGMTVVALGTSLPELTVSMVSAINDAPGMAIGNVVGSNIFNLLMIIGVTAMVSPIKVDRSVMTNQMPLMVVSALALLAMGNSSLLNGTGGNVLTRVDAIFLLLLFGMFVRTLWLEQKQSRPKAENAAQPDGKPAHKHPVLRACALIAFGLGALIVGGDRFVAGATALAIDLGVSEAVIGLTIVAAGTSLPELATSVVSALKHQTGLAIGNVVGSNIMNILLILGCSGTVRDLPFNGIGNLELGVLVVATLLFWLFTRYFGVSTIKRWEGAIMVSLFLIYTIMLIIVQ